MKVVTAQPMTVVDVFSFTGGDATCNMNGDKVRIMNMSPRQEIEVERVVEYKGKRFGLKPVPNKPYQYLAMLVK